ncbi:hypothetical protein F5I97DRAFT_1951639 [Phlebopus sp. FC_14]|nr:hypothetical protein F5I97DRAFT_1951639 [Phlebopus sp. FC_14]
MHLFTPQHVLLIAACYPPSSALLAAAPEYQPNTQELSRLTYYAANHPSKIQKLGSELEKRARTACSKASAGYPRARASLLITLAIVRALAIECRRDLSLLSHSLLFCLKTTLDSLSSDREICARAASVFTAWCTYTDGHVIGADEDLTHNYLSVLRHFSTQCIAEHKSIDQELTNRTRLIGLAAVAGAVNSEALYASSTQFKPQAYLISGALLSHVIRADLNMLEESIQVMKENTTSIYLAEFRTLPTVERKAASIHAHIDGETGPSQGDVLTASLRALSFLLRHSHAAQVGLLLHAASDNLDELHLWSRVDQCRWFAQKACEWTQYQYRYAVPSRLVEHLLGVQDTPVCTAKQKALTSMLTTVFTSPIPLVNLSTSDIVSNLITLVLRRVSVNADDDLLPLLVEAIASLGTHVYYSDQIQDLASELISRLVALETQGPLAQEREMRRRSQAIRCLLAGLIGLMLAGDIGPKDDNDKNSVFSPSSSLSNGTGTSSSSPPTQVSRRARVSGELWHETLSLLCDGDYAVRSDYAHALVAYLRREISKRERPRGSTEGNPSLQGNNVGIVGDSGTRSLLATHAYLFMLATTKSFGIATSESSSPSYSTSGDVTSIGISSTTAEAGPPSNIENADAHLAHSALSRRSAAPVARSRKVSNSQRLLDCVSEKISASCSASLSDYALILQVLTAVHEAIPIRGLLTGIPMLIALDAAAKVDEGADPAAHFRANVVKEVLARVWLVVGRVWDSTELMSLAEKVLSTMAGTTLPDTASFTPGVLRPPEKQVAFPQITEDPCPATWSCVNADEALSVLTSCKRVQEATGLDRQGLLRRFTAKWSAEAALREAFERSNLNRPVAEGGSALLKLSPALMAIENLSLQSLNNRSVRGVGVMDLREALEGRAGASNPALVRPPSISTLDHSPSLDLDSTRLALTRTKSRPKKRTVTSGSGEVRDVLNRLGIGKQSGNNLLKASFSSLQRPDEKCVCVLPKKMPTDHLTTRSLRPVIS